MLVKSTGLVVLLTGRCALQSKQLIAPVGAWTTQHHFIHNTQVCKCPNATTSNIGNGSEDEIYRDAIQKVREGRFEEVRANLTHPEDLKHFRNVQPLVQADVQGTTDSDLDLLNQEGRPLDSPLPIGAVALPHPIWSDDEVHTVMVTHKKPEGVVDYMAYHSVQLLRKSYDWYSGFNYKVRTETMWLNVRSWSLCLLIWKRLCAMSWYNSKIGRLAFLETVAAVPGMVAAMVRHLHSLRRMRRDHGWIHTLLEEAENERMHLMTVLQLKRPSWLFRMTVLFTQGIFVNAFSLAYLFSPRFCHRFVGYLEEEAVITYSKLLKDISSGSMQHWKTTPAPPLAIRYWNLMPDANMNDVMLAIRADEAHHRVVNHTLSSMRPEDYNPYGSGK